MLPSLGSRKVPGNRRQCRLIALTLAGATAVFFPLSTQGAACAEGTTAEAQLRRSAAKSVIPKYPESAIKASEARAKEERTLAHCAMASTVFGWAGFHGERFIAGDLSSLAAQGVQVSAEK